MLKSPAIASSAASGASQSLGRANTSIPAPVLVFLFWKRLRLGARQKCSRSNRTHQTVVHFGLCKRRAMSSTLCFMVRPETPSAWTWRNRRSTGALLRPAIVDLAPTEVIPWSAETSGAFPPHVGPSWPSPDSSKLCPAPLNHDVSIVSSTVSCWRPHSLRRGSRGRNWHGSAMCHATSIAAGTSACLLLSSFVALRLFSSLEADTRVLEAARQRKHQ